MGRTSKRWLPAAGCCWLVLGPVPTHADDVPALQTPTAIRFGMPRNIPVEEPSAIAPGGIRLSPPGTEPEPEPELELLPPVLPEAAELVSQSPVAPAPVPMAPVAPAPALAGTEETVIRINPRPPTMEELFRLETEPQLHARIRKESERYKEKLQTPELTAPARVPLLTGRGWPALIESREPFKLCFSRLVFRPRPAERTGRQIGHLQPFISTGFFYYDLMRTPLSATYAVLHPVQCDFHRDLTGGW